MNCSQLVSQPISSLRAGMPVSGRWRPHQIGHEGTVEIVVQFGWTRTHLPSFNDCCLASELRVALYQPGHNGTLALTRNVSPNDSFTSASGQRDSTVRLATVARGGRLPEEFVGQRDIRCSEEGRTEAELVQALAGLLDSRLALPQPAGTELKH